MLYTMTASESQLLDVHMLSNFCAPSKFQQTTIAAHFLEWPMFVWIRPGSLPLKGGRSTIQAVSIDPQKQASTLFLLKTLAALN
eukprot:6012858-Amphidinium_carterae.1